MTVQARQAEDGLWLLAGPVEPVPEVTIWDVIEHSLGKDVDTPCIRCGSLMLDRAEFTAEVARIPWQPGHERAGLWMSRTISSVIATLAIWKNNAVYVPIAVEHPPSEVAAIAARCELDVIITDRLLDLSNYRMGDRIEGIDTVLYFYFRIDNKRSSLPGDRPCYIAHTPGSGGDPRGAMISHAALLNRIACMQRLLSVSTDDRFLYKSSVAFDVHVWEFTLALASGCMLLVYRQRKESLFDIVDIIRDERVTVVGFAPASLYLALRMDSFIESSMLRAVLCGGEAWRPQLARHFYMKMPGRLLYNSYGSTETTIAVGNWLVPDDPGLRQIALGRPLSNIVFAIDEQERLLTERGLEIIGTLSVGGVQVAMGYVDSRRTDRFSERLVEGRRCRFYATGDRVRLEVETGDVFFQGSQDQIEIGVRIELEGIEEAVRGAKPVEACVAILGGTTATPLIWVIYTSAGAVALDPAIVRNACRQQFTDAIAVSGFQQVASFPLGQNGKIDRAAVVRLISPDLQPDPAWQHHDPVDIISAPIL